MEVCVLNFFEITHIQPTWRGRLRHSKEPHCPTAGTQREMNHRHELVFLHLQVCGLDEGGKHSQRGQTSEWTRHIEFKRNSISWAVGIHIWPGPSLKGFEFPSRCVWGLKRTQSYVHAIRQALAPLGANKSVGWWPLSSVTLNSVNIVTGAIPELPKSSGAIPLLNLFLGSCKCLSPRLNQMTLLTLEKCQIRGDFYLPIHSSEIMAETKTF